MQKTLYQIDSEIEKFLNENIDENGEVHNVERLEQLNIDRDKKINNIVYAKKNNDNLIAALETEQANLKQRLETAKKTGESLNNYIAYIMQGMGTKKLITADYRVKLTVSKQLIIDRGANVPAEYMIVKPPKIVDYEPQPDKIALKKAIENGEIINGVHIKECNNIKVG